MPYIETRKDQVYILMWYSWENGGVLSVSHDRETALKDWKKYHDNPRLINEFLGNDIVERMVNSDPDVAIECWDVQ
jgi:hypothetical protein